jgi:hypothetical protein
MRGINGKKQQPSQAAPPEPQSPPSSPVQTNGIIGSIGDIFASAPEPLAQMAPYDLTAVLAPRSSMGERIRTLWERITESGSQSLEQRTEEIKALFHKAKLELPHPVVKLKLGGHRVFGFRAEGPVSVNDELDRTDNGQRRTFTAECKARGQPVTWVRTAYSVPFSLGVGLPIPMPAPVEITVGGKVAAGLRHSITVPILADKDEAIARAKESRKADIPLTAAKTLSLPRGSEWTLSGRGMVSAFIGLEAVGARAIAGPFKAGGAVGITAELGRQQNIGIKVKRLDGDRVYVRIDRAKMNTQSVSVGGDAGFRMITEERPYGEAVLATSVVDQLGRLAELSKTFGRESERETICSYAIDLSQPDERAAFDALFKKVRTTDYVHGKRPLILERGPLDAVMKGKPATRATFNNHRVGHTRDTRIAAPFLLLYGCHKIRNTEEGQLVVESPTGTATTEVLRPNFTHSHSGLSGKSSVTWEGFTVQRDQSDPETFFHLHLESSDDATHSRDVKRIYDFATAIDAPFEGYFHPSNANKLKRLFNGSYGATTSQIDFVFTAAGISKMLAASEMDVRAAYAVAEEKLSGNRTPPRWDDPDHAARRLLEQYLRSDGRGTEDKGEALLLRQQYAQFFPGRDLKADARLFTRADGLARKIEEMKSMPRTQLGQAFVELGEHKGFDIWATLAALYRLAGQDQAVVHDLQMKSSKDDDFVRLETRNPGVVSHELPDVVEDGLFAAADPPKS